MTALNRARVQKLRTELDSILAEYGKKNGMTISIGKMVFSEDRVEAKFEAVVEGGQSAGQAALAVIMKELHLNTDGVDGRKLVSYNSRSYKYPFVFAYRGKNWKCSEASAISYFGKK
jgi:hypothetical protein